MGERIGFLPRTWGGLATRLFLASTLLIGGVEYSSRRGESENSIIRKDRMVYLTNHGIWFADLNKGEKRVLFAKQPDGSIDNLDFSNDGKNLLFGLKYNDEVDYFVLDINENKLRLFDPLLLEKDKYKNLRWTEDSKGIVFEIEGNIKNEIMKVDVASFTQIR